MTLPLPGPGDRSDRDPWYPSDPASAPPHHRYPQQYSQPYSAPPQYGTNPQYGANPQYGVVPHHPGPHPPQYGGPASYGVDPLTNRPYSEKSKLVAGLLQLLPGFFMGLGGIGRLYAGHTVLGAVQLATTLVGWASFWIAVCGSFLVVPILMIVVYGAVWLWFVIDGIVLMAGHPKDGQGRPLRT